MELKKVKKPGASAVELLLYFRVDVKHVVLKQLDLVSRVAAQCVEDDILLGVRGTTNLLQIEAVS